ncbi:hypothetical protein F4806DRAFT_454449 [Annulohypoxylon nitens]|nr:hypothetical protein F4806DRAFT_454449 [Annulohypoxylon nitens]
MAMELALRPLTNSQSSNRIWEQNEPILRQLYEVDRKTLKEVKQIMESQYNFPVYSRNTFETKLRDLLGLRKKFKKADWVAVHQHLLARDGKDTGIYLNGTRIPRKKAWKEIRRSGARSACGDQHARLPAHITVRTPSPVAEHIALRPLPIIQNPSLVDSPKLSITADEVPFTSPSITGHNHGSETTLQLSQGYQHQYISINSPHWASRTANSLQLALEENVVALRNIPWVMFNKDMFSFAYKLERDTTKDMMVDLFGVHSTAALEFMPSSPMLSFLRDLDSRPAPSIPAWNISAYNLLAQAIYQISNNIGTEDLSSCPEFIQLLLKRTPRAILLGLFRSDLPAIRSVWEVLAYRAGSHGYKDAFSLLMEAGLWHLGWIFPKGHFYLASAVCMGAVDIVRTLIKVGVRADDKIRIDIHEKPAIVEAFATGNVECAGLLLGACDINRIVCTEDSYVLTSAGCLSRRWSTLNELFDALCIGKITTKARQDHTYPLNSLKGDKKNFFLVDFDLENEARSRILDMILDYGANVDLMHLYYVQDYLALSARLPYMPYCIPIEFRPTILEMSYYQNLKLFERLDSYSSHAIGRVTRPGICLSAKQGSHALFEYLASESVDPQFDTTTFLELVLAEQFLFNRIRIDIDVIRGLIEYGVDPKLGSLPFDTNYLLRCLITKIRENDCLGEYVNIIKLLLQSGLDIDSGVLETGVEETGINILQTLSCHGADIASNGAEALVMAAYLDNYEAVSWLLGVGVDVNAMVHLEFESWSILALSMKNREIDTYWDRFLGPASCKMLEYLIDHGAVLKNSPHGVNAIDCLYRLFSCSSDYGSSPHKFEVELGLRTIIDYNDLLKPGKCLLEAILQGNLECFEPWAARDNAVKSLAAIEMLLRRGALSKDSRVLASLICHNGRYELIQEVLNAGVDINAYCPMCSDIDTNKRYITPIQAATFRRDHVLVDELIRRGADVNRLGMGFQGKTALQFACASRPITSQEKKDKLTMIKLLIDNGADVNAPAAPNYGETALQAAAEVGDLETVLLLIHYRADPNAPPDEEQRLSALDQAVSWGRLDIAKYLLNVGALSRNRGRTGYRGAIFVAKHWCRSTFIDLIWEHIRSDFQVIGANLAMSFQDDIGTEDGLSDCDTDEEEYLDQIENEMMGYCS